MTIINSISNFGSNNSFSNNNTVNQKSVIKRSKQMKNDNTSIGSSFKNDNLLSAHVSGEGVSDCKLL
ncbi:hypothetical protein DDB_G0282585 [Dictyostelium discoideum AX4]|uniref:Uncharacterized protein DDB_G0282585 n=1 Tax=Dictyostelium discoideum TaxID=44689 RepID=Y1194_DICDI|nr:hypothetical protein DDB_G0282585 [Dictyostelium discoideum AX4]Q54S98.1 RecName: Full=Uncharacterized protein DDB_G0282585 [Dictyostelium discoideum]EAL66152.1 hypothetical protein DDB_G0282585 [Dictyostelium discoideum AX4]|eukprot:XP_640141.1 hypothetical protein DDB_G0282585 [Dictyostelium discoideum AX4]